MGIIQNVSSSSDFSGLSAGVYQIHLLIYNPATLNLSAVVLGATPATSISNQLLQGGGSICGNLTETGGVIVVEDCGGNETCNIGSGAITISTTTYCTTDDIDFGATASTIPIWLYLYLCINVRRNYFRFKYRK